MCLLGAIDLSRRQGKMLYMTYLDFRNYFNLLLIAKIMLILWKLRVPEKSLKMIEQSQ